MKQISIIPHCPHCQTQLRIQRLECDGCGLGLDGNFAMDALHQLNAEDLHFVRLFLHCEGSIRDMEKALGISYPTVKARLASVNSRLNSAPIPPGPVAKDAGILDQLESGEVDYETALAALKNKKKAGKSNA